MTTPKQPEVKAVDIQVDYQYLRFIILAKKDKTNIFQCQNKKGNDELGIIKWYSAWRQYCYFPSVQAVYSAGCLKDISDFLLRIEAEHHGIKNKDMD